MLAYPGGGPVRALHGMGIGTAGRLKTRARRANWPRPARWAPGACRAPPARRPSAPPRAGATPPPPGPAGGPPNGPGPPWWGPGCRRCGPGPAWPVLAGSPRRRIRRVPARRAPARLCGLLARRCALFWVCGAAPSWGPGARGVGASRAPRVGGPGSPWARFRRAHCPPAGGACACGRGDGVRRLRAAREESDPPARIPPLLAIGPPGKSARRGHWQGWGPSPLPQGARPATPAGARSLLPPPLRPGPGPLTKNFRV